MSGGEVAHAQQVRKRRERNSEEEMGIHNNMDNLSGWEFKIIRSATKAFKKSNALAKALATESLGGWELFEKLDDSRVRLKRPTSERQEDNLRPSGYEPYRTTYGMSENSIGFSVALVIISLAAIGFALSYYL